MAIMHSLRAPLGVELLCFEGTWAQLSWVLYIEAVARTEVGVARKQSLPKKSLSARPDRDRKFYGANLAEVFRTPLYDCSLKNVSGVPDFALTRLKGGSMEMQQAPAYPEDRAMLICVALAPTSVDRWRARIDGQDV